MGALVISYSRSDKPQVGAVVSLLTSALRDVDNAVYWDGKVAAGDPWFEQLMKHIDRAPQLFVFWCQHAQHSKEVEREFKYALGKSKRVVPVLLDDTPLPHELSEIHGIDLRGAIRHSRIGARGKLIALTMIGLMLATFAFVLTSVRSGPRDSTPAVMPSAAGGNPGPGGTTGVPITPPKPPVEEIPVMEWSLVGLTAVGLIVGFVLFRRSAAVKIADRSRVVSEFSKHLAASGAGGP